MEVKLFINVSSFWLVSNFSRWCEIRKLAQSVGTDSGPVESGSVLLASGDDWGAVEGSTLAGLEELGLIPSVVVGVADSENMNGRGLNAAVMFAPASDELEAGVVLTDPATTESSPDKEPL